MNLDTQHFEEGGARAYSFYSNQPVQGGTITTAYSGYWCGNKEHGFYKTVEELHKHMIEENEL